MQNFTDIGANNVFKTPNYQESLAPKGYDEKETTFSFSNSGRNKKVPKSMHRGVSQNHSVIGLATNDPDIRVQCRWFVPHTFST